MAAPPAISNRVSPVRVLPVSAPGGNRISDLGPKPPVAVRAQQQGAYTDTSQATVAIGPGQVANVALPGISFYFPSIAGGVLGVLCRAVNAGQTRSIGQYFQGTGLRFGTDGFQRIEITNVDPVNAITVLVVVGGGVPNQTYDEFIDKRVIVTNNAASNVLVENGLTTFVAFKTRVPAWADSLGAGATQIINGGYQGKNRKQIILCNDDGAANILTVFDAANNIAGSIQPSTAFTFETSDSVSLNNPNAGPVTCHIGEIYYTL